ncbi:hypothetical protein CMI47_17865 [Candidatus Pacearchaeota archaeon]|nr:hypothetical protein [Candidatus Pacearchaeota archaeon]|tara:strand:+ start:8658 stop:8957 length:300 start_codon:yes stop_codon:yes gene_type:complete
MPVPNTQYARRLSKLSQPALLVDIVYIEGKGFCMDFEDPILLAEGQIDALKALKTQLEDVEVAVQDVSRQEAKARWMRGVRSALDLTTFVSALLPSKDE